ncbi:hypothetical protein B0T25DRAFT_366332 [Lasiosphaeria hispida]|uniref:Uncharacterized protein n=1 Tax=Lasiosphaeria hispida TaxID=260671 RepID=A0AAJ0H5I2_9PEZI|nr:hypothetical protein B0T25DRAFT_366332 [Lasiosphaeria hispida]
MGISIRNEAVTARKETKHDIILAFTVVTIIFLPILFITSFFALGIQEFPKDPESGEADWPMRKVSEYLFGISIAVSMAILIGIGLFFARKTKKSEKREKKRDQLAQQSSKPLPPWKVAPSSPSKKPRPKQSGSPDGASSSGADDENNIGNGPGSGDSISDGDDNHEYAPIFSRWRWHTRIPWVRRLWLWNLYEVRRSRHRVRSSQEEWEWDYPLRRWRSQTFGRLKTRVKKWWVLRGVEKAVDKGLLEPEEGREYLRKTWDAECWSEDERMLRGTREDEHRDRVKGRKKWLAGLFTSEAMMPHGILRRRRNRLHDPEVELGVPVDYMSVDRKTGSLGLRRSFGRR